MQYPLKKHKDNGGSYHNMMIRHIVVQTKCLQNNISHCANLPIGQRSCSSELSSQSGRPSHSYSFGIHCRLSHWNSFDLHWESPRAVCFRMPVQVRVSECILCVQNNIKTHRKPALVQQFGNMQTELSRYKVPHRKS